MRDPSDESYLKIQYGKEFSRQTPEVTTETPIAEGVTSVQ